MAYIILEPEETVDIIALLAGQLADRATTGNAAGACPRVEVWDAEKKQYRGLNLILETEKY